MRISKLLSAICAAAFLAGSAAVRAQDTTEQAAARAALMQKMAELNAQQAATNTAAPSSFVAPAPAGTQPVTALESTSMQEAAAKAQAAAKAKADAQRAAAELKAKKEADRKAAEQKAAGEAAAKAKAKADQAAAAAKAKADAQRAAAELKAKKEADRKAAEQKTAAQATAKAHAGTPPAPVAVTAVKPQPQPDLNYAGKSLGFKPVEAPPPPVSAQKVAKLQALLAKYMANQVSPDEYQKQRAAILAEP